jgi:hypothetical protein
MDGDCEGGHGQLPDKTPSARKVPKGQVNWERVKDKKSVWERSYEARVERESEGPLVPDWMKAKKVVSIFLLLLLVLTILAYFIGSLRYLFPLTGIIILIGSYFLGGGLSEWHSAPPTTTISARSMLEYRYGESASNWDLIMAGVVIGGLVFLSGLLAILLSMLI